jgi:hypothetical protein
VVFPVRYALDLYILFQKDYERKSSVTKKISGRDPQRAWRQEELIGGKPPVVK